jgi:endoglucanase
LDFLVMGRFALVGLFLVLALPSGPEPAPAGAAAAPKPPAFFGVNLASAGFAPERLPGVPGQDYIYPTRAIAQPFIGLGMNTVRLPVVWERLQPKPLGPLDEGEVGRLDRAIAELSGFPTIIIDVHNYGRYYGKVLEPRTASAALLPDLWRRLAKRYGNRTNIVFGLMNEPHDQDAHDWRSVVDDTVAAIRQSGARNLLLVSGVRWSGGHSWFEGGDRSNAAAFSGFRDPGGNFLFEIHQYLDSNSSGTGAECISKTIGRQRLQRVTDWLRGQRAGAVLGEFGGTKSAQCLAALDDLLQFLDANGDVWRGWTYWAAGDWWGDDKFSIQPANGQHKPQAEVLRRHIASYAAARGS